MNNTRCFSFGCSYTRYYWATWADFIGCNFDSFTNFGRAGASNTFIMNKVFEVNEIVKFDPRTDYIVVMFTGMSRFSYISKRTKSWTTLGNIRNISKDDPDYFAISTFVDNIWNESWAIYQTWIAVKAVKEFLTSKNLKHKILMGIDNSYYKTNADILDLDPSDIEKIKDIYNMLDVEESLDEYVSSDRQKIYFKENNISDDHPTQISHFKYMSKYFPEFISNKSVNLLQKAEKVFDSTSREIQEQNYDKLRPYSYYSLN